MGCEVVPCVKENTCHTSVRQEFKTQNSSEKGQNGRSQAGNHEVTRLKAILIWAGFASILTNQRVV